MFCVTLLFLSNIISILSQPCPNECNAHGRCMRPARVCECHVGWSGGDCSEMLCPRGPAWADVALGTDNAHNLAECSNMGICDRNTGVCSCSLGFTGKACERKECPSSCSNLGKCQSMNYYAKTKDPGSGTVFKYTVPWDADMMYGCNCDRGFYGPACQLRTCPTGDDPLTGVGTATITNPAQLNTIQRIACKAGAGSFTLTFRGRTTKRIPFNAKPADLQAALDSMPTIGAGNTKIAMAGSQACLDSSTSWTVEFLQAFGPLPLLVADASQLSFSDALNKASITVAIQTPGSKEDLACSNRGMCDSATGICTCSTNFDTSNGYNQPGSRGDCGYATQNIAQCPGTVACSAHGQCSSNPTYVCTCSSGWTGADCSYRACPVNVAWFALPAEADVAHITEQVECSNMGVCDRVLGVCSCSSGFTGTSCSRMVCPGSPTECSSHGSCLDMMALAALANVNGDLAGYTYGAIPNNPLTWDASMIRGCYCDKGYQGHDCSLFTCPTGDDPLSRFQADEQQTIKCTSAGSGSLVFTFRQKSGVQIGVVSTLATVKSMLEAIPGVGKVIVELLDSTQPDKLCTTTDTAGVLITFLTTHGNLPLLQVSTQFNNPLDKILIEKTRAGTKENIVCSGRGKCDTTTGICSCFSGFSSSDGMGGAGTLADCGYVEPIIPLAST